MLPHASRQKVVFLGEQAVGKTSIINRFINDQFDESQRVLKKYIFIRSLKLNKNLFKKV